MLYNVNRNYLFLNGKKVYKFQANIKNAKFPSHFCIGRISKEFDTNIYVKTFNPFAAKGVKYDPRQQNNDFDQSGMSSQLKFCTGNLEVASDSTSHNMIGLDHQNLRNSNFNFVNKTKYAELENAIQHTKEADHRR